MRVDLKKVDLNTSPAMLTFNLNSSESELLLYLFICCSLTSLNLSYFGSIMASFVSCNFYFIEFVRLEYNNIYLKFTILLCLLCPIGIK